MSHKRRNEFIDTITKQIRFPFDRKSIAIELEDHLSELEAYFSERTHDHQEAQRLAILEMGDPEAIGKALNRVHKPIWGWLWLISKTVCFVLSVLLIGLSTLHVYDAYQSTRPSSIQTLSDQFYLSSLGSNPNHVELSERFLSVGTIKLDHQSLIFDEILLHSDGTMVILYRDNKAFNLFGNSPNDLPLRQYSHLILEDGTPLSFRQNWPDMPKGTKALVVDQVPLDTKVVTLDYQGYSDHFKLEIQLRK